MCRIFIDFCFVRCYIKIMRKTWSVKCVAAAVVVAVVMCASRCACVLCGVSVCHTRVHKKHTSQPRVALSIQWVKAANDVTFQQIMMSVTTIDKKSFYFSDSRFALHFVCAFSVFIFFLFIGFGFLVFERLIRSILRLNVVERKKCAS